MNAVEIEEAVSALAEAPFDAEAFPFAFLAAFGNKETAVKRLRAGATNQSDLPGGVLQRSNIHILVAPQGQVAEALGTLRDSPRTKSAKARYILATDGMTLEAEDLSSGDPLVCNYADLPNHFGFFLPLAGITTVREIRESAFDIRATSRLNKLYVELLKDNPGWGTPERRSAMNHFMARLIFCFFAEDTGIFPGQRRFTLTIDQMSARDSSNTHEVIETLFRAMNTETGDRPAAGVPRWADVFPYVNGGLFSGGTEVPRFSKIARSYLLRIGNLDWTQINPDIFGSMIQAVADDEERGALGMHYTSVPNILKVLNPLFLDDLRAQLEAADDNPRMLLNLRKRMSRIRVFDPACGSGNFLVIAYKQMREIEAEINRRRGEPDRRSEIPLTNFRGIELREFPAEIARLALIIAEYQADELHRGQKEAVRDFLPLSKENWITCGNSLRVDWLSVCPPTGTAAKVTADDLFQTPLDQAEIDFENEGGETFICGNPPFAGQKKKSDSQRSDMARVMPRYLPSYGELDYVAAFYVKAAEYISKVSCAAALVSTNSVTQGRHVPILWPAIEKMGCEIVFCHRSFLWKNNAAANASVYCVIVAIARDWAGERYIYEGSERRAARRINGYLVDGPTVVVEKRKRPLSRDLQMMRSGNMPLDNGNLLLSPEEADALIAEEPSAEQFVRRVLGAKEINQGLARYCLWIGDDKKDIAEKVPEIKKRIASCAEFRRSSSAPELAESSHAFRDRHTQLRHAIVIPNLSSERRPCRVPIIVEGNVIATNLALAIYDGELFQISVLASRLHHLWVEAVCGKLKMDFRYSNDLGWHTFPMPALSRAEKDALGQCASAILLAQEAAFPATLNELYNGGFRSEDMPEDLRRAHEINDETIERIYIGRRFRNDTERLEKLFELYTKMTATAPKVAQPQAMN
ncbi:N-6 DNA methylase [Roseibacterium beibuensis]|uniref:class I SAM-dependent DNA methyltransferase n=1 Tax=[Roseibacterium] beibuensis TaxID=1193142 RepID=UPI00217E3640|nr:DNA methyltransferase [Roseibacterium beibuensis]MCS6627585.1 N-6 DNA methylase [Roseibacterium beibuensis]